MPIDTRLTYQDLCELPYDGKRYEIIQGDLIVTAAPRILHQRVVTRLSHHLQTFVEGNDLGHVFVAPVDVVFSEFDVVEPDIIYISKQRAAILTENNVQGAPDLVVEVLSEWTAKIDRTAKLKLYAKYGVAEYWLLDTRPVSADIYRGGSNGLELCQHLGPEGVLTTPILPGFSLPLQKLVELGLSFVPTGSVLSKSPF
jgi:Uma2 family endonuclease